MSEYELDIPFEGGIVEDRSGVETFNRINERNFISMQILFDDGARIYFCNADFAVFRAEFLVKLAMVCQ